MGSDISLLPTIEQKGGVFRDAGQVRPMEQIMVNHGDNLFRIRLFVNPNTSYSATNGAIQDLNYSIALAQRLKATGAKILLDFHYSDTWADPGHQAKPAAWSGMTFTQLNTAVHDYTVNSLTAFRNAGVMPAMVQIGNETTNGMLYGTTVTPANGGQVVYTGTTANQNQSWKNFGALLNSGIAGVRDVDSQTAGQHTQIALHVDGGDVQGRAQYYFGQLSNVAGVNPSSYDVMGMSFYPTSPSALPNLQTNLSYLANSSWGKKVMVLENNYPWKGTAPGTATWSASTNGQRDQLIAVRDLVRNLPNARGQGVVWWYPESIQVPGTNIWQGGAVSLFDDDTDGTGPDGHDALASLGAFSLGSPTWNTDADGNWYNASNWSNGVPMFSGDVANFTSGISTARTITVNAAQTVGMINFNNGSSYTIASSTTGITLQATVGQASINVLSGSHTIAAPVTLASDITITVAPALSTLSLTGAVTASGRSITKAGLGTVQTENLRASALSITGGTFRISAKASANSTAGTSIIGFLSIDASSALDLTNNALIVPYASLGSLLNDTRVNLLNGRLKTSLNTAGHALGYADNATLGKTIFGGQTVNASNVLIGYTFAGDANLDGRVNGLDFNALASGYESGSVWSQGDFNYDGMITSGDFTLLSDNFNQALPTPPAGGLGAIVPEPMTWLLPALPFLYLGRRRVACRKFEGLIRKFSV